MTSMASQLDSLSFIGEGSTKRKEILAKFLDLEVFERKYRLAKEDTAELRGSLRRLEEIDFEELISDHKELLAENSKGVELQEGSCAKFKTKISSANEELATLQKAIESIPAKVIDIAKVNSQRDTSIAEIENIQNRNRQLGKRSKAGR